MEKEFNITGICRPAKHYMADVSKKLERTFQMVHKGKYFIINRPRQYGKTTTLYTIADILRKTGDYIVFNISFEGIGDLSFEDETNLAPTFVSLLARSTHVFDAKMSVELLAYKPSVTNLDELSNFITDFAEKTDKKLVLLIDEVDKSSNNQLFISFLAMLRDKYLAQDDRKTFHSIVLAGVHDIKSLKIKINPDTKGKLNSPWNIAAEFTVDMNLQPEEIKPMLDEYAADRGVKMDTSHIANRLFYYTSGYPFLVSKLCKMFDEDLLPNKEIKEWTEADLALTTRQLVRQTNTNFDSLIKNLENNEDLYKIVYKILIENERVSFNIHNPLTNFGAMYGILVDRNGLTAVHNLIYSEIITNYMADGMHIWQLTHGSDFGAGYRNDDNTLNMEAVLLGFQTFMKKEYSRKDRDFLERNGRLVFLAFIKPIINGSGYDFKEPQISEERRLDVVITYYEHRYVAELKVWYGAKAHAKGLTQLADYLDRQNLTEGYLIIFDHAEVKEWKSEWINEQGKRIFAVWV